MKKNAELTILNQTKDFFLQGSGLGSWDWWLKTNQVLFDRLWCEMLGLDFDKVDHSFNTWNSLLHPDDRAKAFEDIWNHIDGKTSYYENVHRLQHVNGSWVWILDRGRISEWDENGKPIRFCGIHINITELKEIQRKLEETQKVSKVGSWSYDVRTKNIYWSPQLFEFFPEKLENGPPSTEKQVENVYPADREKWLSVARKCAETGEPYQVSFRSVFDGKLLWIEEKGQALKNEKGEIICLYGTCQDITERVIAEEENQLVFQKLQIGIWKYNPVNKELIWDKSMYELFGVEEADFSGHYEAWEASLSEDSKEYAVRELELAIRGEKEFNTIFQIEVKGKVSYIGGLAKVFRDEAGAATMMIGINWDCTEEYLLKQKLEEERKRSELKLFHSAKMASLGEMAAGLAHEINNPLAIIQAKSNLLMQMIESKKFDQDKLKEGLEKIVHTTTRISKIISGLRLFSRDSSKDPMSHFLVSKVVEETIELCNERFKNYDIKVKINGERNVPMFGRATQLSQVLLNLLNNAFDAVVNLKERWIEISYFIEDNHVKIEVVDSGLGIPAEISEKMLQPFFTTKEVGKGTGLGLSISKGIIEDHSGKFYYKQKANHTCFGIELPQIIESPSVKKPRVRPDLSV